ncbi:MAG: winged helix-turn-helix domain-containing protein [Chlamydiia bacterium]
MADISYKENQITNAPIMEPKNNLTWREAIIEVLKTSGKPMRYPDIAAEILGRGLKTDVGATPAHSVGANIYTSIKSEKSNSPFEKTGKGEFKLKTESGNSSIQVPDPVNEKNLEKDEAEELEKDAGIIRAIGMFWRRDLVDWKNNPKILGRWLPEANQASPADPVNFCNQRGVYILHDGNEIVYVGRAGPGLLGTRLFAHTYDRLNGRWNRFSWFGLLPVKADGQLEEWESGTFTQIDIIITMEALLIEGLEPKQNRKRGEADFKEIEYIQIEDPNLKKKKKAELLAELIANNQSV